MNELCTCSVSRLDSSVPNLMKDATPNKPNGHLARLLSPLMMASQHIVTYSSSKG